MQFSVGALAAFSAVRACGARRHRRDAVTRARCAPVACNFSAPRGYLLRGANDCQRVRVLGLQAVLFGVSHGYQGLRPCLGITAYGLLFGLLAEWRKSLRPGIIAHAGTAIGAALRLMRGVLR